MKNNNFYISTAIAYSSAIPHIGNVYEVILADAIARFKRLEGYNVLFQTGTDEHGQKIAERARNNEISPQVYVDQISGDIKRIYDMMDVSYDKFVRTTDDNHIKSVQSIFKHLLANDDIYLGKYEGWYSVSEEAFVFESDIVDGLGPNGDKLVWTSEEVYFFRLSKYQDRLIEHINNNSEFIMPESRKNEMMNNFLKEKLPDLSITRTSFDWGIKVLKENHVSYVWIDALSNYITSLGYHVNEPLTEEFKAFWPANIHLIGKDILRFHTIYWPIILMALKLPLPKTIFAHPWILFDKAKMSKSTNNVVYTDDLVKHYGIDVIRYFVLHEIPYGQDGNLTHELIIERNNSDLANTIGNLVNRTIGMINKYRNGKIKKVVMDNPFELNIEQYALKMLPQMKVFMDNYRVADALEQVMILARAANKYIDVAKPWELIKDENKQDELDFVLYNLVETIRFIAVGLKAFIPNTANKIATQIGVEKLTFESLDTFGLYNNEQIGNAEVLFERFDLNKKIEEIIGNKDE